MTNPLLHPSNLKSPSHQPCHRGGDNSWFLASTHRQTNCFSWVRACSCAGHLTRLRCLGLFEQVSCLLSCLSWQLSFPGPGLVIVIAASSDHLWFSLPPLCPINPPCDQSSVYNTELNPRPQIFNAQMTLDLCPTILSLSPGPRHTCTRASGAHFITKLAAVIYFYFDIVVFIFSNL